MFLYTIYFVMLKRENEFGNRIKKVKTFKSSFLDKISHLLSKLSFLVVKIGTIPLL